MPRCRSPQFVRGRLLYDEGKYEEAAAQFEEAETTLREHGGAMADLHLYLGESLARLDRYRRRRSAVPRGAARLPAQRAGLHEPGDALSRAATATRTSKMC